MTANLLDRVPENMMDKIQKSHKETQMKISPHERDRTMKPMGRFAEDENPFDAVMQYLKSIHERLVNLERLILDAPNDNNEN
jgi:cytochrome c556